MNHASLFSGIGGFDLAAEWMGWTNRFNCEIDPFCKQVLKHYWPDATQYDNIKTTDFTAWRGRIDILTGGFPCQPYSAAGKRLGKEDERHLFPEMLRAIREIRPRWIVGENVLGLVNWSGGLVFEEVHTDLEAEGYEVQAYVLPACGVGAPHQRYRIWFVAHCDSNGQYGGNGKHEINTSKRWQYAQRDIKPSNGNEPTPDTYEYRCSPCGKGQKAEGSRRTNDGEQKERCKQAKRTDGFHALSQPTPYTSDKGLQGGEIIRSTTRIRPESHKQPSGFICPTWEKFPTQSPVCSRDDGLSDKLDGITFSKWRNESIKAYGNAVVPQVVYEIFKAIEKYNQM
jgi:DNA (cytosine-5)-methyltransferase 1